MGKNERVAYRAEIYARYQKANKAAKSKILDEFCEVCGYHRKHALRLLRKGNKPTRYPKKAVKRSGRKPLYDATLLALPLRRIWQASDYMCGKRLKAVMPYWLPHYAASYEPLEEMVYAQLLAMSAATIDRLLKPYRAKQKRRGLCGTKPGTLLKNQIPIKTDHWDVNEPGFLEADTVAHSGNSLAGNFVWSLTMTDILTTWTECRATWNKGASGVCKQIEAIEQSLPFDIKGFDCDNVLTYLSRIFSGQTNPYASLAFF